jgi:glucose/arabinose dehydrogenase
VEAVRDAGGDEDDRTGAHVANLVSDRDPRRAGEDDIGLVLGVGLLEVGLARGQDVQAEAQVRDREELEVRPARSLPAREEFVEFEGIHGVRIPAGTPIDVPTYHSAMPAISVPNRLRFVASAVLFAALAAACGGAGAGPSASAGAALPSPAASPAASPRGTPPSATAAPASPGRSFDPAAIAVALEPVVGGLSAPLAVTSAGDGSGRIFVVEQAGTVRIVEDGRLVERPFLDITDRVLSGGERGLLGLAFHPDYPDDPRLFVDYTDADGTTQIASFKVDSADPDRADPASEVRILSQPQPYANHNGGAIAFGPDGYLYISFGDGGSGGDPHGNGQSLATALGKILRIDIDATEGGRPYAIPDDNPFVAVAGAEPAIWLYGLRNPWRMSFDRATGDLWIGDVGQSAWEEIDVARAGTGGLNYGWNRMEGSHCFRPASRCEVSGLTLPVAEYSHDGGNCTVIGGGVYRGAAQPALGGGYLFGDYCSGRIWAIDPGRNGPTKPVLVAESGATLSSFGEDEAGELYATDLSAGELLRVTASRR